MKKRYESPMLYAEQFVANAAVSVCTVNHDFKYTFDCMKGPQTDAENVINDSIATGCNRSIGYAAGINTARDYSTTGNSTRHSNNNPKIATWGGVSGKGGYLQVTYTGAEGLVYTDGGSGRNDGCWSVENGYVKHSTSSGGMHHNVAPIIDVASVNASW